MITSLRFTPDPQPALARVRDLSLLALSIYALFAQFWIFRSFVFIDSFITYRYAENLARGLGFVYSPAERVLGTSTPLFTLILSGFDRIGVAVPTASAALFIVCLILMKTATLP